MRTLLVSLACLALSSLSSTTASARPRPHAPKDSREMAQAIQLVNRGLGLESQPPPHCVTWGYGHEIKPAEAKLCAESRLKGASLPGLGTSYVLAILMADIGPQTVLAISLDSKGWAVLSCDPGKPCPARRAGADKMGKRVVDRVDRACKNDSTVWLPAKKGCP